MSFFRSERLNHRKFKEYRAGARDNDICHDLDSDLELDSDPDFHLDPAEAREHRPNLFGSPVDSKGPG